MGKINSKQKGSVYERKVAKILSDWSGQQFHRTPQSGALHWENDKRVVSDIVPPQDIKWPFSVECKAVEASWEFNTLIEGTAMLWKHWKQATEDAQREDMIPMLAFSKNYRNNFIAIQDLVFGELLGYKKEPYEGSYILVQFEHNDPIIITQLEVFLKNFELSDIQKLCK